MDFLKDELRAPQKVDAGKTRLISSAPLDYTIAWRMYFGAFSTAIMNKHTLTGMAPGICCYSEWRVLAQKLQEISKDNLFDGDFRTFDACGQPCIYMLILNFINKWYDDGPENARIREILWLDLVHSRHIGGVGNDQRFIYQWLKSLPSGHPFTTIVNSIYALVLLVGCYIKLTGDWIGFWRNVYSVTYGDDNVSSVGDCMKELFNQRTVIKAMMDEFKIVYTPGNKSDVVFHFVGIDKITFLKRSFAKENGRWLCPIEKNSFLYCSYWCQNKKLKQEILHTNLELTLEELSFHPQEVWDEYASKIEKLIKDYCSSGTKYPLERLQYQDQVIKNVDNWY
jgi:hypothetical protein